MSSNNCNSRRSGPLPKYWMNCPSYATGLFINKFVVFKTPLDSKFDNKIPQCHRFTPRIVLNFIKNNELRLGLWIDLTNTDRYYDKEEIIKDGIHYVKLQCFGHDSAPTRGQTNYFITLCENFINKNPSAIIGVHCTHGFNRTGFLLVSFMVEKMNCSLEVALREFANIRPPGIYRDYIRELYRRYDYECNTPPTPLLPYWCCGNVNGAINNPILASVYSAHCDDYLPEVSQNFRMKCKRKHLEKNKYKQNSLLIRKIRAVETIIDQGVMDTVHLKAKNLSARNSNGTLELRRSIFSNER